MLYPLGLSILLAAAGIVTWHRLRVARWLCIAAILLLLVFSCPVISRAVAGSLEDRYPDTGIDRVSPAQAIVVLGGTIHGPNSLHTHSGLIDSSDRLLHTLRLYRAGKAPLVVCSGGPQGQVKPESETMCALLQEWGLPAEALLAEPRSVNTRGNATETYAVLQARGIQQIVLVTSAMHMTRAAATFRKAGFTVTPSPADYRTGWSAGLDLASWLPDAGYLRLSDIALKEWAGLLVYRLRGWI